MSIPIVAHWGVTVPGRLPTPSEGRAQVYARVGPIHQQAIRSFDNGTSLQFGPLDLIDEFKEGHPFFEQVLHIDNALNNITILRGRHDGEGGAADRPFERFRGEHLAEEQLARVRIDDFYYIQTPSKFAQITTTLSIFSHALGQPKKGAAHPAEVDTRFGILTRPDPVQHTTSHTRDIRQRGQQQSSNVRDTSLRVQVIRRNNLRGRGCTMQRPTQMHGNHHAHGNNPKSNNFTNRGRGNYGRGNHVQGSNRGNQRGSPITVQNRQLTHVPIGLYGNPAQNLNGDLSRFSGRFHAVDQGQTQREEVQSLWANSDVMFGPYSANSYTQQMASATNEANDHNSRIPDVYAQVYYPMNMQVPGQNNAQIDGYNFPMEMQVFEQDRVQSYGQTSPAQAQGDSIVQTGTSRERGSPMHFPFSSDTRSFPDYSLHPSTSGSPELRYSGNGFPPGPAPMVPQMGSDADSYLANVNERLENLQVIKPETRRPASTANVQQAKFETHQHLGHFFSQCATREPSPVDTTGTYAGEHFLSQKFIRILDPNTSFGVGSRGSGVAGNGARETNSSTPASPRPAWL